MSVPTSVHVQIKGRFSIVLLTYSMNFNKNSHPGEATFSNLEPYKTGTFPLSFDPEVKVETRLEVSSLPDFVFRCFVFSFSPLWPVMGHTCCPGRQQWRMDKTNQCGKRKMIETSSPIQQLI